MALEHGHQDELKEHLDHATFTEGSRPSDHSGLRALASQSGLPEAEVDAVLASDRYSDAVPQALDRAWSERSPRPLMTTGGSVPSCEGDSCPV